MGEELSHLEETIKKLRTEPFAKGAVAHPLASELRLPDGSLAPASLRAWAAFDEKYPSPFSGRRSEQLIANRKGKLSCGSMKKIIREVCLDPVMEELGDDDETLEYLRELCAGFTEELPGHGVRLEPFEAPDRVLWLAPDGNATVIWYERDEFARREPFAEWVVSLFKA